MRSKKVPGHITGTMKPETEELLARMNVELWEVLNKYGELLGRSENFTVSTRANVLVQTTNNVSEVREDKSLNHEPYNGSHDVYINFKDIRNSESYEYGKNYMRMEHLLYNIMEYILKDLKDEDGIDRRAEIEIRIDKVVHRLFDTHRYPFITESTWWLDVATCGYWDFSRESVLEPIWNCTENVPEKYDHEIEIERKLLQQVEEERKQCRTLTEDHDKK